MPAVAQEAARVLGPAFGEIGVEMRGLDWCDGRMRRERSIGLRIAGEDRELDAAFARQGFDLGEAVAPVGGPAEEPQHDEARLAERPLDIEIDGEIVLQLRILQSRSVSAESDCVRGLRDRRELAVGRGEEDDVARRSGRDRRPRRRRR